MHSVHDLIRKGIELSLYVFVKLALPVVYSRFGIDYTDSAFHYMAYTGLRSIDSLTFLYTTLGNWWQGLFGDSFISYRICVYSIYFASVSSTVFYFGRDIPMLSKIRYIAFAMIITTSVSFNMLNWDAFSILFMSFLYICTHRFIVSNRIPSLLLMAALVAVISAIRLPSAIVVIPICLVIYATHRIHKSSRNAWLVKILLP